MAGATVLNLFTSNETRELNKNILTRSELLLHNMDYMGYTTLSQQEAWDKLCCVLHVNTKLTEISEMSLLEAGNFKKAITFAIRICNTKSISKT